MECKQTRITMKQMFNEIWLPFKGLLWFGGGWTISEIELWNAWISLGVKFITFGIAVIMLFRHINKYLTERQEVAMYPDNPDNEDGTSGAEPDGG